MNNEQKSHTPPTRLEQASGGQVAALKLGLDVHAGSIVVVRIVENGGPQPAQKFTPEKFLVWVAAQLKQAERVYSCYEAGPLGYVLHRKLVALGVENVVIQPVRLQDHGVKNDRNDARELAQRLDRYVAGNRRALASVRVPTEEEERERASTRQRAQLKREEKRVSAQGQSLLLSQGYREKKSWWTARRWEALRAELPEWLTERLGLLRRLVEFIHGELVQLDRQLAGAAVGPRPKGLGGLSAEIIDREVGDWRRFRNRRQVGSYTGLCGGLHASGETHRSLSITKHGNVRLRTALVELAWRMVLHQGQCPLVRKWWPVLGNPRAAGAARKKAIVAIARQLAVDLWRWRTDRIQPEQLGWVMVNA